ncbi:MAG: hypothetical protein JWR26_4869 [Pedosphaera sp.]|nr:hypothetical protein [Pedosphaera sp.]
MSKKLCSRVIVIVTAFVLTTCAHAQPSPQAASGSGYFKTTFQSESQFIVETIVTDLAEQMYYAAKHRLPEKKNFSVTATEKAGSPADAPVYDLQIKLDEQSARLKLVLNVNGPIWSPDVYREVATALAKAVGLSAASATAANAKDDTALVAKLLDIKAETIEREDLALSEALEKDFTSPKLHEQAALLLGVFVIRDNSGLFTELRLPLSRMTAHLAMAGFLGGSNGFGVNGRLAEAILLMSVGDSTMALEKLKSVDASDAAVAGMIRSLQASVTGDYRALSKVAKRSPMEELALFGTITGNVNAATAWLKIDDKKRQSIEFVRIANEMSFSVQMGHQLALLSIPLEMQEIQTVYSLAHGGKELSQASLVEVLNELPERCVTAGPGGEVHVRIIGWGQWAQFLQNHLCHAVEENFGFFYRKLGLPDDARQFSAQCDMAFGGLRLYPFVRRFNCMDVETYHKAVDDGTKLTVAMPHLIPLDCWNSLSNQFNVSFAPLYAPNPNLHFSEWFLHDPPPGTTYNVYPRLAHPGLTGRPDLIALLEHLHEMSPYDPRIIDFIVEKKYNNRPTYEQAMGLCGPLTPWSASAVRIVARTVSDKPERFEELMLQAARLDPRSYYTLGDYAINHDQMDKAAQYLDKACELDPDAVSVSNHAEWRVRHYLKKGETEKAREIADAAGEVYSEAGLIAKGVFMELTTNYDGAYEWFAKIEERYNHPRQLFFFMQRYKAEVGDSKFDAELRKREKFLFPKGMEKVALADFHTAPTNGVLILGQNDLLLAAHMKKGDVICAINGVRVQYLSQYTYVRGFRETPELDLIVWQDGAFHEIKANPPKGKFGVDFNDYRPKPAAGPGR